MSQSKAEKLQRGDNERPSRKRKQPPSELEGENRVQHLLTDPKSELATTSLTDIMNEDSWYGLSPQARERLCRTLPSSFFASHQRLPDVSHPSRSTQRKNWPEATPLSVVPAPVIHSNVITEDELASGPLPTFLTDPAFQSACSGFQDQLASGWYKQSHLDSIASFQSSVTSGNLHVPWKDEAWTRSRPSHESLTQDFTFFELTKHNLLSCGDILSFTLTDNNTENSSTPCKFTVDIFLHAISSTNKGSTVTFLLPERTEETSATLPSALLLSSLMSESQDAIDIPDLVPPISQCAVRDLVQLTSIILSRLPRRASPKLDDNVVAQLKRWKVFRWDELFQNDIAPLLRDPASGVDPFTYSDTLGRRGGRIVIGTLFHLRYLAQHR